MERKKCKCSLLQAIIVYIGNSEEFTDKLLEVLNEFSSIAEYNIKIKKLLIFLLINHDQFENVIGKTKISVIIAQ